ncbi:PD40 domain-containing protein [Candidatus Woesearchaeota archaeon]|nr:PD40 domain-containing protein [Candidatus Woesearchaeota archaeon]
MNRMTPRLFIVCIVLFFVSSCAVNSESSTTDISAASTEGAIASSPANTLIPTPTPEIIPTPTSTAEPLPPVKTQCVNDISGSQRLDLQGVIVLKQPEAKIDFQAADESGQWPNLRVGFFFFDINNRQILKSINNGRMEQVSPDGKYLAYVHDDASGDKQFLGILDSSGKVVNDFSLFMDGSWQSYYNWQNSEKIRLVAAYNTVEARLLDPITKSHSLLKNDWDNAYSPTNPYQDKVADWKFDRMATKTFDVYGANILYDPSLTRVVYPKDEGIVSLVDVETQSELASARFTDWGRIPSWSPNGEYLTILNREGDADEFYLVSRDGGQFQRITDFAKELGGATITDYTWSPDGTQIAFWLNMGQDEVADGEQSELAIIDISSRQVTRLCIQGISTNAHDPWAMRHPEPVWSPDGKYIMFTQWDDANNPRNYFVLVIDPITGELENISQNTAPIGWMVAP